MKSKDKGNTNKNITAEYIMIYLRFCVPGVKKPKVPIKRFSDQANYI